MELTTELEKQILESVPKKVKPFMKTWLNTQLFCVFFESYSKTLQEDHEKAQVMCAQVEQKIKESEAKKAEAVAKLKALQKDIEEYPTRVLD
jgi:hypothetical protein